MKKILILGILIILLINSYLACDYSNKDVGSKSYKSVPSGEKDSESYKAVPGASGEKVTPDALLKDAEYCRDKWIQARARGDEKSAKFWHGEMMQSMNEYYDLVGE